MNARNTITKIALGVATVALIFSLVTLIRAIVLGAGILFAAIQVIGTMIVFAICVVMLYVLRTEEQDDEETEQEEQDDASITRTEAFDDSAIRQKYKLSDFEE